MFYRHHSERLLFPIVVAIMMMVISYRPKYHLKTSMPAGFFRSSTSEPVSKRDQDKKIAWAYWETAQMNVQWKYPYSHPLPPDPPAEFSIDAHALGASAADPATRIMYWRRLQEVWFLPETWQKDYGWDWTWISDPLNSAANWMQDRWNSWFAMHGPR